MMAVFGMEKDKKRIKQRKNMATTGSRTWRMHHASTLIGGAIVGSLSFGVWPAMWKN